MYLIIIWQHIYSSHAINSRAVLPGSLGSGDPRYSNNNYNLFYNGCVIVSSPFINPLGIYLAPVPSNTYNEVDVWFHSAPWHGHPLVQVVQSEGSFTESFEDRPNMPLNGYIKLEMYANALTQLYKHPYWWCNR